MTEQEFLEELNKLCLERGFILVPDLQVRRQFDGSFTLVPVIEVKRVQTPAAVVGPQ